MLTVENVLHLKTEIYQSAVKFDCIKIVSITGEQIMFVHLLSVIELHLQPQVHEPLIVRNSQNPLTLPVSLCSLHLNPPPSVKLSISIVQFSQSKNVLLRVHAAKHYIISGLE